YGKVLLKIPQGTQNDAKFRIKGNGAPNVRTKMKGDQHVIVTVVTPTKLTNEQRRLFEQLLKVEDASQSKSMWNRFKDNFKK
ncbi:MAG: hypothetical protein PHW40_06960, partial [Candidatus Izemoplasmatales bacterium]|nr:hypothetical protein [Candidatus Izemoplasmatales bacterium]